MRELRWWLPGLLLGLLWVGLQEWRQQASLTQRGCELGRTVASLSAPALQEGQNVSLAFLEPLSEVASLRVLDSAGVSRGSFSRPVDLGPRCEVPVVSEGQRLGTVEVTLAQDSPWFSTGLLVWTLLAGFGLRWLARGRHAPQGPPAQSPPTRRTNSSGGFSRLLMLWQSGSPSRRLRDLETHYRELCDNARDLIVLISPEGNIIYANRAWRQTLGLASERTLGDFLEPAAEQQLRTHIAEAMGTGMPGLLQVSLRAPGGREIPVEGHFSPSQADSGQSILLGVFRDLTERLRALEELRNAEERFRQAQKMEAIGRLAGGVAHDFNNLLTIMSSVNGLMRMELEEGSDLELLLGESESACHRAAGLTRQLLVFSRRQVVCHERLQLDLVVEELLKLARRVLGEDVLLQVDLGSHAWIEADQGELDQVLMNLLVNARDALERGGEIHVRTRSTSTTAEIAVSDTGCGIPAELMDRIFEPYFTTKPTGRGTGLGLSTVFAIVESIQGRIEVKSRPGQGTTFTLRLPLARSLASAVGSTPLPDENTDGHETILLVEDERPVCQTVARSLRSRGYRVLDFTDPVEALSNAPLQEVDLLLSDLIMPGLSGTELAAQFLERRPELKILFVSGYPGDTLDHEALGRAGFLAKPFDLDQLARSIRRQLAA